MLPGLLKELQLSFLQNIYHLLMYQPIADKNFLIYFMAIDKCKFRRKVVPGDVLRLHVETLRGGSKIWRFKGRGEVDGDLAAEAEFTAMLDLPAG